jgi:hypothetical protein
MFSVGHVSLTVRRCSFIRNVAEFGLGGGIYNGDDSSPLVLDSTFSNNTAWDGGGMFNWERADPTVVNCTFTGNTAFYRGGGMSNWYDSAATVINCILIGNEAGHFGGGMYNGDDSSPIVVNCTFSHNNADVGGGVCTYYFGSPVLSNCILWSNTVNAVVDDESSMTTVHHCDIQGGWSGEGDYNIDVDPSFVRDPDPGDDGIWGTEDDDYGDLHLQPGSLCIDAADNTAAPLDEFDLDEDGDTEEAIPFDLDGNPRFVDDPDTPDTGVPGNGHDEVVDMGAYEYQVAPPCPADINADGTVNVSDLLLVLAAWGDSAGPCDITCDGRVGVDDLLVILGSWGPCT